jgi:hypothetical protein
MMSDNRDSHQLYRQLPYISAAAPDARFIYESLDAAKSLLTTLNNFVDPEHCLRRMPSRFYLYIIYSAVFLYKVTNFRVILASLLSRLADCGKGVVNQRHDRRREGWHSPLDQRDHRSTAEG